MGNSVIEAYRQRFQDPRSDDEITLDLGSQYPDALKAKPDFAADFNRVSKELERATRPPMSQEFPRTVKFGVDQAQAKIYDTVALAGDVLGSDTIRNFGEEGYRRNIAEAQPNAPTVPSIENIEGPGDAARYVLGLVGSQAPQLALTGGAAAAGALAAPLTGVSAMTGAAALGGAAGFSQMQNRAELKAQGAKDVTATAFAVGTVGAILESLVPLKITNRFLKGASDKAAKDIYGRILKEVPINALTEMSTEVSQEIVSIAGELYANRDNKNFSIPREQILSRLVNNGLAGGLLGAGAGAIEAIPGRKTPDAAPGTSTAQTGAIPKTFNETVEQRFGTDKIPDKDKVELEGLKRKEREGDLTLVEKSALQNLDPAERAYWTLLGEEKEPDGTTLPGATTTTGTTDEIQRNQGTDETATQADNQGREEVTNPAQNRPVVADGARIETIGEPTAVPTIESPSPEGMLIPGDGSFTEAEIAEIEARYPNVGKKNKPISAAAPTVATSEAPVVVGAAPLSQPDPRRAAVMALLNQKEAQDEELSVAAKRLQDRQAIVQAEAQTNPAPTPEQKQSGDYAKGPVELDGIKIDIENPMGSTRTGTQKVGKQVFPWSVVMPATYGEIKSVTVDGKEHKAPAADGDKVDIYIGPNTASPKVWVIDQKDPKSGKFDEHKVMFGFSGKEEAMATYVGAFSDNSGASRIGAMTEMTKDEFKQWVADGATKVPLGSLKTDKLLTADNVMNAVDWTTAPVKEKPSLVGSRTGKETVRMVKEAFFDAEGRDVDEKTSIELEGKKGITSLREELLSQSEVKGGADSDTHRITFFEDGDTGIVIGLPTYHSRARGKEVRVGLLPGQVKGDRQTLDSILESGRYAILSSILSMKAVRATDPNSTVVFKDYKAYQEKLRDPARQRVDSQKNEVAAQEEAARAAAEMQSIDSEGNVVSQGAGGERAASNEDLKDEWRDFVIEALPKLASGKIKPGMGVKEVGRAVIKGFENQDTLPLQRFAALEVLHEIMELPWFKKLSDKQQGEAIFEHIVKGTYEAYVKGGFSNESATLKVGQANAGTGGQANPEALAGTAQTVSSTGPTGTGDQASRARGTSDFLRRILSPVENAVSAQRDAEYMAAVNRGDMATAQRMVDEAAKAAGYNVGPVWHGRGTHAEFSDGNPFEFQQSDWGYSGPGIYFTQDRKVAESHYSEQGKGTVFKLFAKLVKPFGNGVLTQSEANIINETYRKEFHAVKDLAKEGMTHKRLFERLGESGEESLDQVIKPAGFDGVFVPGGTLGDEMEGVVYKPSQIKSADPITRDAQGNVVPLSQRFDVDSNDIRFRRVSQVGGSRATQADVIQAINSAIEGLAGAGFNVAVFQQNLASAIEFFRTEGGGFSNAANLVSLVFGDAVHPSIEGLRSTLHEGAHALFSKETPVTREAIRRAIDRITDEELGIKGSADVRIRQSNPAQLEDIAQERLAEHLAQTIDPVTARSMAAALWRLVKDLYLRAASAVARAFYGETARTDAMALDWFRNNLERIARGEKQWSMIDWLGGGRISTADISRMGTKLTGESGIAMRWNAEEGRMEYRDILPVDVESMGFNLFTKIQTTQAELAKLDSDYMAAVNRGDMEEAQRMVNALAIQSGALINPNTGNAAKLWHGSMSKDHFTEFKVGSGIYGPAISLSPSRETARQFSEGSGNIREFYVFGKKHVSEQAEQAMADAYESQHGIVPNLWGDGDHVLAVNKSWIDGEVAVKSPSQIKSADAVTRDAQGNVIPLSKRFNNGSDDIRFRKLQGVNAPRRASIDQDAEIKLPDVAAQNSLEAGLRSLWAAFNQVGSNQTSTGQPLFQGYSEFLKFFLPDKFSPPRAVIDQHNAEISRNGLTPVNPATQIADLSEGSQRDAANRAVGIWNKVVGKWSQRAQEADTDLSGKRGSKQAQFDRNAKRVGNLASDYTNADAILTRAKEAFKDALDEFSAGLKEVRSESRRSGVLAQTIEMIEGEMTDDIATRYQAAMNDLFARISTEPRTQTRFYDLLRSVAELGVDFQTQSPSQIRETIRNAAQFDTTLLPMVAQNENGNYSREANALLSIAISFARRDALAMNALSVQRAGTAQDKQLVDAVIAAALSDSRDAINEARKMAARSTKMNGKLQVILNTLDKIQRDQRILKKQLDDAKLFHDFYSNNIKVIDAHRQSLERILGAQGAMFEATEGALYPLPPGPNAPAGWSRDAKNLVAFKYTRDSNQQKTLKENMDLMRDYLTAHPQGSPGYKSADWNSVEQALKQLDDNAIQEMVVNPSRSITTSLLGSVTANLKMTGMPQALAAMRKILNLGDYVHNRFKESEKIISNRWTQAEIKAMKALGIKDKQLFRDAVFTSGLTYAQNRKDIQFAHPTQDAAVNALMPELRLHLMGDVRIRDAILRPGTWNAVEAFFREHERGSIELAKISAECGIKVNDDANGFFRNLKGSPLFEGMRLVPGKVFVTFDKMRKAWDLFDFKSLPAALQADPQAATQALQALFTPQVWTDFVAEIANRSGVSAFNAPATANGIMDAASVENTQAALQASNGSITAFASALHQLSGGTTDPNAFLIETVDTLHNFYKELKAMESERSNGKALTISPGLQLMMEARRSEEFPSGFLEFRALDQAGLHGAVKHLAFHGALGREGSAVWKDFDAAEDAIALDSKAYKVVYDAAKLKSGGKSGKTFSRALESEAATRGVDLKKASTAAYNLATLQKSRKLFEDWIRSQSEASVGMKSVANLVGSMVSTVLQGVGSAFTDTTTLFQPILEYGLSGTTLRNVGTNIKSFAAGNVGSMAGAVGMISKWDAAHFQRLADIGHYDSDNEITLKEKIQSVVHGNQRTLEGTIWQQAKADAARATDIMAGTVRAALSTGFSRQVNPLFPTFKPFAPFSHTSLMINASAMSGMFQAYSDMVARAVQYFRANPLDLANPTFKLTSGNLHYNAKFGGILQDDVTFDKMKSRLEDNSMSLETLARDFIRRGQGPILPVESLKRIARMTSNDIVSDPGIATRTGWMYSNTVLRVGIPLLGWSVQAMAKLPQSFRGPAAQSDKRALRSGLLSMAALMGVSLAYSLLRDLYDEDVLGKKANVMKLSDENFVASAIDRMARIGMPFGFGGDFVNSFVNTDVQRDFSIDSRVFAVNSMTQLWKAASTWYHQDAATYATVGRQIVMSMGGSGYLQNAQILNNLMSLDNAESRVTSRINVNNWLRSTGRTIGLEVKTSKGQDYVATPVTPWITEMQLAALSGDFAGFNDAKRQAIQVARERGEPDAAEYVAKSFQSRHPLRSVFKTPPTHDQYRKLLAAMPDGGREDVQEAVSLYNRFLERLGLNAYEGKAEDRSHGRAVGLSIDPVGLRRMAASSLGGFGF